MLKKATLALAGGACLAWLALSGSVRAEHFDFDPGMVSPYDPQLAAGDGKPYEWYYQGINLEFSGGYNDGRENSSYQDSPTGNIPYVVFDGTDKSPAGHCLQIVFGPPNPDAFFSNAVGDLRFSYKDSGGTDRLLFNTNTQISTYNVVRMWIKNTGNGLYWKTKIADKDGANGAWNQSASMNIWRLEKSQADCTTNVLQSYPTMEYVTIIGVTGNYTVCEGHLNQNTGLPIEDCHAGGG
jgi:hypothetical protein